MEIKPACATCQFRHETDIDPSNIGGPRGMECRRYPPVPNVIMAPGGAGIATLGSFPPTKAENWCGEYQPDLVHIDDVVGAALSK